jgi:hypothetical protein
MVTKPSAELMDMLEKDWTELTLDEQYTTLWFAYMIRRQRKRITDEALNQLSAWKANPYTWNVPSGMHLWTGDVVLIGFPVQVFGVCAVCL